MGKDDMVGVFDSGVGGVSVLIELMKLLPQERFYYFGDSVNAPYGKKTTGEVQALTLAAAHHLLTELHCKAMVVACNTATAAAIEALRQTYPKKIIIGIEPAIKLACDRHPGGAIGIMATDVTLREKKLAALLERVSRNCRVLHLPSPGVVEAVEAGLAEAPEALALMEEELGPLRGHLDALVLGCTHYPFIRGAIRQVLGSAVDILDGGEGTARETKRRLSEAGLLRQGEGALTVENSSLEPQKIRLTYELLEKGLTAHV